MLRDLGVGFGVFREIKEPVLIKDQMLINMGESYIVTSLVQQQEDNASLVKLKLKVYNINKGESPDLFTI